MERLQEMLELSQAKKQRAADALQAVHDTTLDHPAVSPHTFQLPCVVRSFVA